MLSEKIRALRKKSGLSQEELAERLDVSRQAVSKWELGSAVPTADKLVDIADFFGVSLDYLMRGEIFSQKTGFKLPESSKLPKRPNACR
ncbi:MAG: helix-turn-helix domain-containing protein, partial [Oscillospiraceae bacterium]|nr:helix-turn-helix domain-containing protein [Oscillospiraceae bacterium]